MDKSEALVNGHYQLKLPFRQSPPRFPDGLPEAKKGLYWLEKKMERDPDWSRLDIFETTAGQGLLPFAMKNMACRRVQIHCSSFKRGHFVFDTFLRLINAHKGQP